MTKEELQKFKIISHLWEIVKLANNEEIIMGDLYNGIPDGETPEDYPKEIIEDFQNQFELYAGLAVEALKDGLYLADKKVYKAADYSGDFEE